MAQNTKERIDYFLLINIANKEDLSSIRKWDNLKVAFDKEFIWVCNFEFYQIDSVAVKSIPKVKLFYRKGEKLFLLHSLLPDRKAPDLLWTPIERALPIKIEKYNHNFFGLTENLDIKLVKDSSEKDSEVLLTNLEALLSYVEKAAAIRLKNCTWVLLNNSEVLLFGKPILPINGTVYWIKNNSVFPSGYTIELEIIHQLIETKIHPEKDAWIIWNSASNYFKVAKDLLVPLSLSSVRKTMQKIKSS